MQEQNKEPITLENEPEVIFNAISDQRIFGVRSEEDDEMIFEISGYDLQIRFNRDKINSLEDVEGVLEGIKDMFRRLIMADLLDYKSNDNES